MALTPNPRLANITEFYGIVDAEGKKLTEVSRVDLNDDFGTFFLLAVHCPRFSVEHHCILCSRTSRRRMHWFDFLSLGLQRKLQT